ncbi:MAG: tol-pal system protein YbgF [Pseudomonadota bacterium]
MNDKRTLVWIAAVLAAGVAACQPSTPKATVESELSDLSSKVDYLNVRMGKLEKAVELQHRAIEESEKNNRQGRADLSVSVEDLRTEVKALNGSVNVLAHQTDQANQTDQKVREDFDTRITELDQKVSELQQQVLRIDTPPVKSRSRGKAGPEDEKARYETIRMLLIKKKKYDDAAEQFHEFILDHPKSPLAAGAQYWIGEAYYAKGDYARSISEYQTVVEKYPKDDKVCDALLKQGMAFMELKEAGKAKLFLGEVGDRCPKTATAAKAAERLEKLAASGPKK